MTETERLLVEVMERMADRFESGAVLRGGMVLRVLGCERFTNDVDYVLIPYQSKKDVLEQILETFSDWEGVTVTHSLNSKCLRLRLKRNGTVAQLEIKVEMEVPTRILSTRALFEPAGVMPRLIPVLDFPAALADKLAAWNERRLMRDLYDIWFFLRLGVRPDSERLLKRLGRPAYSRLVPSAQRLREPTLEALIECLLQNLNRMTDEAMAEQLQDLLPENELIGLVDRVKTEVIKAFG